MSDKDCCSEIVQLFFPGVNTTKERDLDTIFEARDECRTVVTSNGDHFISGIRKAQKRDINPNCEDCWGLVILPNADLVRKYALEKAKINNGLTIGKTRLPWRSVGWANLCVRINNEGKITVTRFARCRFCEHDTPIGAEWYKNLRVI